MNNRITRYAKIIEIISISITAAIISFTSIEWLWGSTIIMPGLASSWISTTFADHLALNPQLAQMPFAHRLLGLSVDMVTFTLLILGLFSIIRLMRLFQAGELFSLQVITQFKTLSKVALSWAVYAPMRSMLLSTITTWHLGTGNRILALSVGSDDLIRIFICICFILMTSVWYEGYTLQQERDLTI